VFRIAGRAQQQGHDVRVVAATLVRSLGVGRRGLNNDQRKRLTRADIEKLAGALVERMSLNSDELRQLIGD